MFTQYQKLYHVIGSADEFQDFEREGLDLSKPSEKAILARNVASGYMIFGGGLTVGFSNLMCGLAVASLGEATASSRAHSDLERSYKTGMFPHYQKLYHDFEREGLDLSKPSEKAILARNVASGYMIFGGGLTVGFSNLMCGLAV
ncbi:hypothetical protein COOONC_03525, partial [Cooperia oncophora]